MVFLGPVANADVEIVGTGGVLAVGVTSADGGFGPIEYDGDYAGPLRVRAIGNAATRWTCDFYGGCFDGADLYAFGESVSFDGVLESVLPFAEDDQFVSVSFLSTLVSRRVDVLGPLSSAGVESAEADTVEALRQAIPGTLDALALEVPTDFSRLPLFDLGNLPDPDGADDDLQLTLSVMNAVLIGLNYANLSVGDFVAAFAEQFAADPVLPIGAREFWEPSVENIAGHMIWMSGEIGDQSQEVVARYDALLAPATVNELYEGAIFNLLFPSLRASPAFPVIEDPDSVPAAAVHYGVVATVDGISTAVNDFDAWVFGDTANDPPLLKTQPVSIDGRTYLRVWPDIDVIQQVPPGQHRQIVNVYSTTGEYGRVQLTLVVTTGSPP